MLPRVAFPYREHTVMAGHVGPVFVVRFNTTGTHCLSGGKDRMVHLWNPYKDDNNLIKTYKGAHGYEVLDIAITKLNDKFATCGGDKSIFFWDVATGRTIARMREGGANGGGHTSRINTISLNKDDSVLFSGGYDKMICAWDLRTKSRDPIQMISDAKDSISSLTVLEHTVTACGIDGNVYTYDIRAGTKTVDHIGHSVTSVRASNDGNCLLLTCMDNCLRLLDRSNGQVLGAYQCPGLHTDAYKMDSCLTNDDAYVLAGSNDGNVYFFSLVEQEKVHVLGGGGEAAGEAKETKVGHTKPVVSVDFHPKETYLVTASHDGTVRLWN